MANERKVEESKKGSVIFSSWVAVAVSAVEILVYALSFIPAVLGLKGCVASANLILKVACLAAGYFGFQLTLMFASALLARLFPYPAPGRYELRDPRLNSLWVREALSNLCYRTFVHGLANFFPFPGFLYYRALGARVHPSCKFDYTAKIINPYMVSIGAQTNLGAGAAVSGHVMPDTRTYILGTISIGARAMIGANAFIGPNTVIGDDSAVTAGSVVIPGTRIPSGEIWGGNPARFIRKSTEYREQSTENQKEYLSSPKSFIGDPQNIEKRELDSRLNHSGMTEIILEFIQSKKGPELTKVITNTTPLFSSGLLDSLDFQELVSFLERRGVLQYAPTSPISMESMDTIEQIDDILSFRRKPESREQKTQTLDPRFRGDDEKKEGKKNKK